MLAPLAHRMSTMDLLEHKPASQHWANYQEQALRTLSPNYYGELVTSENAISVLQCACFYAEQLDGIKKQLFYGKNYIQSSPHHYGYSMKPHAHSENERNTLHAMLGIVTEAGEFAEVVIAKLQDDKEYDRTNIAEEIGDMFWYFAILSKALDIDLAECMQMNIEKLRVRFPDKFSNTNAAQRDLFKERQALEGGKNE